MYNFSTCISDKIAQGFQQKLNACSQLLIYNIEVDELFDGKTLHNLNGDELENYRNMLIMSGKKIVIYSSSEPVENLEYYKILFRKAHLLNIKNINIKNIHNSSHFRASENESCTCGKKEIEEFACDLQRIARMGENYGIRILLENQSGSEIAEDSQITNIFKLVKSEYLGLVFNPLEFVKLKKHPFFHVFYNSKLKNNIHFLRISDGLFVDGKPTLPGKGNAELKELASILLSRSFNGCFSFTPYLEQKDMDSYRDVIEKFKIMLMEI